MKNIILKLLSALTIMLSLSACSDLKKEVTIKTNGGEKITLKIKAPREFKKSKDIYFITYTAFYMNSWNTGVDESDNSKSEYKFDFNTYLKSRALTIQSNMDIFQEIAENLEERKDLEEKIKTEGRNFANKKPKEKVEVKAKEPEPETQDRSFWPKIDRKNKSPEESLP